MELNEESYTRLKSLQQKAKDVFQTSGDQMIMNAFQSPSLIFCSGNYFSEYQNKQYLGYNDFVTSSTTNSAPSKMNVPAILIGVLETSNGHLTKKVSSVWNYGLKISS